ncbi:MAG: ECF transporter S component [Candidatus Hodarchaeota archaeon]
MVESDKRMKRRDFIGYFLPNNPFSIAITSIFAALTCVLTMLISIPVPATGGYINIGDVGVMLAAMIFGPIIGALSGGIGSALADVFLGYPIWAPATLIVKGLEGLIVGLISNPRKIRTYFNFYDILAAVSGGLSMVLGYFIVEAFIFNFSLAAALVELPGNLFQFIFGAIISLVLIIVLRIVIKLSNPQVFNYIFITLDSEENLRE